MWEFDISVVARKDHPCSWASIQPWAVTGWEHATDVAARTGCCQILLRNDAWTHERRLLAHLGAQRKVASASGFLPFRNARSQRSALSCCWVHQWMYMMVHMCHYMLQPLLVFARPLLFFQRHFAWKLHSIWETEYRPRCQEGARSAQREIFSVGRPGFFNTFPRSLKFLDIWISGHASRVNVIFEALDGKQVVAYPFPDLE